MSIENGAPARSPPLGPPFLSFTVQGAWRVRVRGQCPSGPGILIHSPTDVQGSTPPSLISPILDFHSLAAFWTWRRWLRDKGPDLRWYKVLATRLSLLGFVHLALPFSFFILLPPPRPSEVQQSFDNRSPHLTACQRACHSFNPTFKSFIFPRFTPVPHSICVSVSHWR